MFARLFQFAGTAHKNGFLKTFVLVVGLALSISLTGSVARAQLTCDRIHGDAKPYSLEWRVENKDRTQALDESGAIDYLTSGGSLTVSEQALAPKSKTALMELIRMISATRAVKFSFKDFEGKETGKLILGIPLANKYSVEITYKSDFRDGQSPRYTIGQMEIVTPSGKSDLVRKNMQNIEGGLDSGINVDLTDYPSIAGKDFKLHVPSEISGEALTAFAQIAPKLELLTKQELSEISRTSNFFKLKALIHYRAAKALIKTYMIKGPFKTFYKLVVGLPLIFFLSAQVNTHFHSQVDTVKTMLAGDQSQWIVRTLDRALVSDQLPSSLKPQIRDLMADFENGRKDANTLNALKKQFPPDLAVSGKFQVSKDQYMWVETVFDRELNRDVTLLFITQDDRHGQIQYSVTSLNPLKYSALIKYIQSRGQFLPLQPMGAAQ